MRLLARATWAAERVIHAASSGAAKVAKAARTLPATLRITQLQPENQSSWPVPAILAALALHEDGDFSESAKLASAFGRDDRISGCRRTRLQALVGKNGAEFDVLPSEEGDQRRSSSICDRVKALYFDCFTEPVVHRILGDVIDIGVSISRIHWTRKNGEWRPTLEPWDMRWISYDHFRRCYVAQAEHGQVEIRPDTGEWLIVGHGWMSGAVRALGMPFFFRGMTWKDWARYCEKHGVPILAIEEPATDAITTVKATKDTFFERLKRVGREGILRLPKGKDGKGGFDAKIVEPKTLSWPSFEAFLKRLDVCIAILYLGQNLSTEVQGGSLAATVAQNRVRLDYLAGDAELLSTAFRSQVLSFWGRFNIEGWDDALAPWPKWNTAEPEDQKAKSTVLVNVAAGLEKLKKNDAPFDERALLESYAIPLLSKEEFEAQQAEKAKKAAEAPKQQQQDAPTTGDDEDDESAMRIARLSDLEEAMAKVETVLSACMNEQKDLVERVERHEHAIAGLSVEADDAEEND